MIKLALRNSFEVFEDASEVLQFLASEYHADSHDMRISVANKFRPFVQAKSISENILPTILNLTDEQRDMIYNQGSPDVVSWDLLPPLVFIGTPVTAPRSTFVGGVETVWLLDIRSDYSLILSLRKYGAISWKEVS